LLSERPSWRLSIGSSSGIALFAFIVTSSNWTEPAGQVGTFDL
jgi:hypothetical protein